MEMLAKEEQESAAADPPAGPSAGKPRRKAIVESESETEGAAPASGSVADETAGILALFALRTAAASVLTTCTNKLCLQSHTMN
jgi:hypothetical protein